MLTINATLEDIQIVLKLDNEKGKWEGFVRDGMSGHEQAVSFSGAEVSAIFGLALHGDCAPVNDEVTMALYEIAEPAMERNGLVGALRIIA